jgi:hypothetical protein
MLNKFISLTAAIWIGAILAISMEAKVKFNASLVDLRIGLDVGRTVFSAFDFYQWLATGLLTLLILNSKNKTLIVTLLIFSAFFIYQSYFILPLLLNMADIYINHGIVEKSYAHFLYIGMEIIKILLLTYLANTAYENQHTAITTQHLPV